MLIALIVVWAFPASGAGQAEAADAPTVNIHDLSREDSSPIRHWSYRAGDDPTWADRHLEPSGWDYVADPRTVDPAPGIHWYRADIHLGGEQDEFDVLAVSVIGMASAFEMYWDGELVGRGGVVSDTAAEEISGPLRKIVPLRREQTTPGSHTIAIRLSNHQAGHQRALGAISLGYHYNFLYDHSYKSSHRVFVGGASLIAGLFCIAMFFAGSRHRSYLLFASYCLIGLFFDLFTIFLVYNEISIEHIRWITPLIRYGQTVSQLFLVAFVIYTYGIGRKALFAPLAVLLAIVSVWPGSTIPNLRFLSSELLPALAGAFLVYAMLRRTTGSIAAFAGLVIWRASKYPGHYPVEIPNHALFYISGDIIFLFCIILSISRMIHEQNRQLQEMKLRSSRLEVDLLKKNIQPHFILNTLQSVMSWIRKKPDNACLLIEALAEEFRMINRIADKKLIPLHQEIELCSTHLEIMGLRMGSAYELIISGLPEGEEVPPMIFHTLVENTLTHSFRTQENGTIRLSCERDDRRTVYQLSNSGSRLAEIARKSGDEVQEGMGLKYIRARLEESFPGRWKLDHALDDERWEVTIAIER